MADDGKSDALAKKERMEFGQAILAEAQKRYDEQRREVVFTAVRRLMEFRDDAKRQERIFRDAAEWYTGKLAAIDAGAFSMDKVTGALKFENPNFDRPNY